MSDLDPLHPWLDALRWDADGLIPAIAQESGSGRVMMFAWMNREALTETVKSGNAVYWSRSRRRLWRKGEESGHFQKVRSLRTDCDGDVLLLEIVQEGGIACHTGRTSCFFHELHNDRWEAVDPVIKNPKEIYK
ncbi:MAG: phosphoribosyl-AMP cyclohydrolase [Betaproteobacteria bacterium]|nr:phosphoribosyl-AMP cyclohydrolase [Betaproteobacteria bacterium]